MVDSLAVHDERASARLAFGTAWEAQGSMLAPATAALALSSRWSTHSSPQPLRLYPKGLMPLMSGLGFWGASLCRQAVDIGVPTQNLFGWEPMAVNTLLAPTAGIQTSLLSSGTIP